MNARLVVAIAAMLVAVMVPGPASGQTYPSRPVRIIPGSPGGNTDLVLRLIMPPLTARLGQPVIAEYRPATQMGGILARAEPDGHTLLVAGPSVWLTPLLEKVDYDSLKDFAAVSSLTSSPAILVVHPSLPVNSVKELIAYARARPGAMNYSSGATGSSYHVGAELLKSMAGVDITRVNYTGAAAILQAVLSGEVQMTFGSSGSVAPHIRSGKLKALAHTGARPSPLSLDLPSMSASGLPGFEVTSATGMFAPAKTPVAVIRRLNQELVPILALAEVREKMLGLGLEAGSSTPEEFAARFRSDYANLEKLVRNVGITGN